MAGLPLKSLLAFLPFFLQASAAGLSGSAITTRYWDCCKPACAWSDAISAANLSNQVAVCNMNDNPLTDPNAQSGCNGGPAYTCSDQTPWAVSEDLSYGFAAFNAPSGSTKADCCACFELTFTSGPVVGKQMIVQATNIGYDLNSNQFDIAIPGGGVGAFNGCQSQYGSSWGAQYGGISSAAQCATLPTRLQPACNWRFDWFAGADNPSATFQQVACPAALTARSGCVRANDGISETPTGPAVVPTWTPGTESGLSMAVSTPASSSSSSPTSSLVAVSTPASSMLSPTSSSIQVPPSASSSPSSGSCTTSDAIALHWGQCGGVNWSGPFACVAGTTCQEQNEWYSQCL